MSHSTPTGRGTHSVWRMCRVILCRSSCWSCLCLRRVFLLYPVLLISRREYQSNLTIDSEGHYSLFPSSVWNYISSSTVVVFLALITTAAIALIYLPSCCCAAAASLYFNHMLPAPLTPGQFPFCAISLMCRMIDLVQGWWIWWFNGYFHPYPSNNRFLFWIVN
jgi:hypothetical protein